MTTATAENRPSILRNYLYSSMTIVLNVVMPLITYPYVARVLGPGNMGRLGIGASLASYFIVAASLGMPIYGVRAIAIAKGSAQQLSKTVSELYLLSLIGAVVAMGAFFFVVFFVPQYRADAYLLAIFGSTIFATVAGMEWFFQGMEEFRYIGIRNVIVQLAFVAALFVVVRDQTHASRYAGLTALTLFVSIAINMRSAWKFVRPTLVGLRPFKHIPAMAVLALMTFAITGYTNIDLLFLGLRSSSEQAGFYIISLRIARMVVTISATLSAVLLPRLSALVAHDAAEFERILSRSFKAIVLFTLPAAVGLSVIAPDLVILFAGDAYALSAHSLRVTAWMIPAVGLSNFLQMQVLVPRGKEKKMLISFALGAIVGAALCWLLVPELGHLGAAIGMLCAELSVLASHAFFCGKRQIAAFADWQAALSYALSALVCGIAAWAPGLFLGAGLVRLACSIVSGALAYLAVLLALKDPLAQEAIQRVFPKFSEIRKKH